MSGKNVQNGNSVQKNDKTPLNHSERMKRFKAKMAKKKQTLRVPNSGKFEHLRKFVASYKQTEAAYNKIMSQKMAQEMAQQNNDPKPETEVKIENNLIVEEPMAKEELQNPTDEVTKENDAKAMDLEDIKVADSDLDDPALDEELEQLEQKIKKEDELKAMGIDPNSVEELDDPEFAKEVGELMQETDEKLEGAALEEAFQSLSNEVDSEIKGSDADDHEIDDPDVDEDINRLEQEIKKEESKPIYQSEPIAEEEQLIATEKPPVIPRKPIEPESIFAKNPAHKTIVPEKKSLDAKYDLRYNFKEAKLKKIFFKEGELSRGNVISEAYEENDIIEAEYDIEEIEHKINEKDTVISHRVSIPNFDDLLAQRRENQEATNQVVSMLSDILKEVGITNQQNDASLAQTVYQKLSGTMENNASLSGKDSVMHDVAVTFFDESYNVLGNSGLSSVDRVVTAQRIADVMMMGYSPLGFVYGELDKYTDNYVMTNSALLKRRLMENGKFSEAEAETLVDGVMSRLDDDSARLQAEFEAKYGKGLTAEDELRIYVPDFHKKYDARIDDELFAENVKKQIGDILRSSGMAKKEDADVDEETDIDEVINETVDSIYDDTVRNIRLMYDYNSVGSTLSYMTNWNYETTLKALNGGTMLPRNPIVTAQRISDVLLKSYTPIAFAENGALNRYANNYIIKNKDDLKERLEGVGSYSEKEIEGILQRDLLAELRRELKEGRQMEQQNAQPQEPIMGEQIENKENVEISIDEITEIKVEEQKEPSLADDFELINNNSNEPDLFADDANELQIPIEENEQRPFSYGSPEELYDLLDKRAKNDIINASVISQMNDIFSGTSSNFANNPLGVKAFHDIMARCMFTRYPLDGDADSATMENIAVQFFAEAFNTLAPDTSLSIKDRAIAAQRIADITIKNYSPLAFANGNQLDFYADNFVINYIFMYKEMLAEKGVDGHEIEAIEEINNERKLVENFNIDDELLAIDENLDMNVRLNNRINDPDTTERVRAELSAILKGADINVTDNELMVIHDAMANTMPRSFDLDNGTPNMTDVAVEFFAKAYMSPLRDDVSSTEERIIISQQIADLMIKNYSPAAFTENLADEYANNFVLNNVLSIQNMLIYQHISPVEIETIVNIAKAHNMIENREQDSVENRPEEKHVNPEPTKLDTHALFQQIENNLTKPKTEENAVVEPQPKEEPKPVYSVPPIPGMNSNAKQEIANEAPVLSQEEREAKELADAKAALDRLKNIHTGTTEERADRARMINYYQGIVNKHKSLDELFKESIELAEKARRDAKEREEREKQLKELDNSEKNDIIEDEENLTPIEKENPFMHDVVGQNQNHHNDNNAPDFEKENIGVDIRKELNDSNVIVETDEDEEIVGIDEEKIVENIEQKAPENVNEQKENVGNLQETKPINDESRVAVYTENLNTYNNMYKLNVDSNEFASSVIESWALITSGDRAKLSDGYIMLNNIFKDTLKKAFDVEKGIAYNEHRLPEYVEIIKSTNELMRSAMYGFTDMYHNAKRTELFETTAFGGLSDKDMADLTVGQSLWSMDQKSDEAWDIQAKEAKNIAEKWMKEDKPHEKMIAEMKALVESNEKGIVSRKEMVDKLTAAEWLLENDEKMMIDDPYDPYNKVPNWGNRYWKTLTETRETLGIDKHTSMRDMIQADYAASAKAVNNRNYNLTQINYYVLDKDVRELADSRDVQMEQFAIQGAAVKLTNPTEKNMLANDMTANRVRNPIPECDERKNMENQPKIYNFIVDKTAELNMNGPNQG